jgi:hypothetical protein
MTDKAHRFKVEAAAKAAHDVWMAGTIQTWEYTCKAQPDLAEKFRRIAEAAITTAETFHPITDVLNKEATPKPRQRYIQV